MIDNRENQNFGFSSRPVLQSGEGLATLLSSIWKFISPIASKTAKVASKTLNNDVVKDVGGKMLDAGVHIASNALADTIEGKNVGESAKSRLNEAKRNIATSLRQKTSRKRKVKSGSSQKKKKHKKLRDFDIFDDDV